MKITELKAGQGKVDIVVKVTAKNEPRVMEKYGKQLKVCNATVTDDSGEIVLSLWNDDVDKVNVGDNIKISNGYVSEFNGKKQLTSGKFGKLEVVSGNSADEEEKPAKSAAKKAKKEDSEDIEDLEF